LFENKTIERTSFYQDYVKVLCMGAQIIGQSIAEEVLMNYLNAKFSTEEQFRRRVHKLDEFDRIMK